MEKNDEKSVTEELGMTQVNLLAEPQVQPTIKCAWGKPNHPIKTEQSFSEIMSEELAQSLQQKEEEMYFEAILKDEASACPDPAPSIVSTASDDCSSDMLIAQMLQMQFNREHDNNLKKEEQRFNGTSKVTVSLSNYMTNGGSADSESDEEFEEDPKKSWDRFEAQEKAFPVLSKTGYAKVNDQMYTKHDVTMSGRRNACRVMEFPPCIQTGDGASFDMQLSNKVYNKLKVYSKAEESRRTRLHDKREKSTADLAVDMKTKLLLYKLINNEVLEDVCGIVASGKESIVLYATGGSCKLGGEMDVDIPKACAVKIFKTTLNEFKTRDKYIKDDYRFKERFSKQNPRKIIHLWAEKEMHNLTRIMKAGIPCPAVVMLKKHILIMEFIGTDMKPASKLKDVVFPKEDDFLLFSAYNQLIEIMHKLYNLCSLVHADLSEYNILWHDNKCYVIDVSQSVEPTHPHALEFLFRDCTNICQFFSKKGLDSIHSPESLFTHISGYGLAGGKPEVINQILDYEKDLELLTFQMPEKPFAFDHCWVKSMEGASSMKK